MAKLPTVVSSLPQDLKAFLNQVREALDGRNGNRLVTINDLLSSGLAAPGPNNTVAPPAGPVGTPSTPRNVQASGAIQNIIVTWDDPLYNGHAYAEVWGSSTDDLGAAVQVGMTPGAIFVDAVGPSVTRYYWVRFVNVLGVQGAFNAVAGVQGVTGSDVAYLLDTLTDAALDPNSDYSKFAVRADFFFVMPSPDFSQEATPTATATGDIWYQPSTEITRTWTGSTWGPFSQTLPFVVNSSPQTINGVSVPAGVYMDAAFIKNGTITNAKIGNAAIDDAKIANLSAGKITAGFISADRIQAGSIDAKIATLDAAVIGTGTINDARIGSLSVDKLQAGTSTTQGGNTFGFGSGTTIYGILTAGFFRSTRSDSAALAVTGINNVALAVGGASRSTALFSNTNGVDTIDSGFVINGITIGNNNIVRVNPGVEPPVFTGWSQAAFLQRRGSTGGSAAEADPDSRTTAYARIAYLQGGTTENFGGKFMTSDGITDLRGITIGGDTNGLFVLGAGVSSVGFTPFTGMHVCLKPNTVTIEPGDICVDTSIYLKPNINDTLSFVNLSNVPSVKGAIGVYTNMSEASVPIYMERQIKRPYMDHGVEHYEVVNELDPQYTTLLEQNTLILVNGVGEGLINVCGENGDLAIGDLIVTSSMPGKGMKQDDDIVRSKTVARSRENVTFSSPTEVQQVACVYLCG
jgi:hypothetical protein